MDTPQASSVPPADPLVGTTFAGRYRIVGKLGEGAMGAVYLGEHLRMGRRDAIKVLRGPLTEDAESVARFLRGARNVSRVRHPNVCTVYDFGDTEDGLQFLAMEYVEGESLRDLLEREGPLPPERAAHVAVQVAEALEAAHRAGIVHRDLKPANVMVAREWDGSDQVKVVDFDIAKGSQEGEEGEVTRLGFVVGTPEYMSPEQLMGERLDGRSDVYSLGILFFRMLAGVLPFRSTAPHELMVERLTQAPLRLEEAAPGRPFPPGLQAAVDRALERKASERQPSASAFGREIAAAVGVPAPAQPPRPGAVPRTRVAESVPAEIPATVEARRAARRRIGDAVRRTAPRRIGLAAAAGAGAVALLAGAWALFGPDGETAPEPAAQAPAATTALAVPDSQPVVALPDSAPRDTASAAGPAAAEEPAPEKVVQFSQPVERLPREAEPPPPARRRGITAADAKRITDRLFERLDPGLSPPRRNALRDSARAIWNLPGAGDQERATAAYILGTMAADARNQVLCTQWAERAVDLRPAYTAYQYLLNRCQEMEP